MNITIHRGCHEIGGSCVEVDTGENRIILDMGMPLMQHVEGRIEPFDAKVLKGAKGPELIRDGILPDIPGLYAWQEPNVAAVIISHAHQDHYGFLRYIHPGIPVYASAETLALLTVSACFLPNVILPSDRRPLPGSWKTAEIGGFSITPHPVDHSAPGGVALEIAHGGRKIFYSGDLRAHGHNSKLFENMLKRPPRNVDALLLEGTMVARAGTPDIGTESELAARLSQRFAEQDDLALLFCSGQNLDRLTSVYQAVLKAARYHPDMTLVIDLYTAYVLLKLRETGWEPQLQFWDKRVKVLFLKAHATALEASNSGFIRKARQHRIELDDALARGKHRVMLVRDNSFFDIIENRLESDRRVEVIWSQWEGYLTGTTRPEVFCRKRGLPLHKLHVGGHATVDDLKRLVDAIQPTTVIPIHTMQPERYEALFPRVTLLNDGIPFCLEHVDT